MASDIASWIIGVCLFEAGATAFALSLWGINRRISA